RLRTESATHTRRFRTVLPPATAQYRIPASQPFTHGGRHFMHAHPRRVPKHDVERSAAGICRTVNVEGEGKGATIQQSLAALLQLAGELLQPCKRGPCLARAFCALTEQVTRAQCGEQVAPSVRNRLQRFAVQGYRPRTLGPRQCTGQRALARSGGTRVSLANTMDVRMRGNGEGPRTVRRCV